MHRRSHRKSKKGCLRCKSRHIKCDESRPSCLNCVTAELCCGYGNISPASTPTTTPAPASVSDHQNVSSSSPSGYVHFAAASPAFGPSPVSAVEDVSSLQSSSPTGVNILHLELLHHMSTETYKDFRPEGDMARESMDIGIKYALEAPYLMHELLAISALHLSTVRPHRRDFYHNLAAELQTHALCLFNNLPEGYATENLVPTFLFSSFLGIHVLFDTLLFRPSDFSLFVDRFVGCLRLHRGVYTIASGSWTRLQNSDIEPLLSTGRSGPDETEPGAECNKLKSLLQSADLSQRSIDACLQSLKQLQWVFDSFKAKGIRGEGGADMIFAWPIMISPEFTDLLLQRRPEALAILAHYAVLLHHRRSLWIINDGGKFLIEAIMRYLGSYWQAWLELPSAVLLEV